MKIWFDLSNAPHINLFKELIQELKNEGHEIIVTCRPLSNTVSLLDLHQIPYTIIGKHYGKNLFKKLLGYPIRVWQLKKFVGRHNADIAISQSSFHSPVAARLMRIPSIYMNDNEHAAGNIPSFLCATRIMIPEFLDVEKVRKQGAKRSKIISYPGVKEGIYLWQKYLNGTRNPEPARKKTIYMRPEPRTAQYYKGGENFLDEVIVALKTDYNITMLIRDGQQLTHYRSAAFDGISVPDKPISFDEIVKDCLVFIGAGGTMTREMAVIGVPTISVYQDELLDVDQHLISLGLMYHYPKLTGADVLEFINKSSVNLPDQQLLLKGKETYQLIKSLLTETQKKHD